MQSCFPTFWGLKVQVGFSWLSSQPAKGDGGRKAWRGVRRAGSREARLSPSSPKPPPPVTHPQPPGCSENSLEPHSPQSKASVAFSEVLLVRLRFMMRGGGRAAARKGALQPPADKAAHTRAGDTQAERSAKGRCLDRPERER